MWKAGQIDDSATPDYIDDTTDAQDAGTNDFALTTTTNNDGFLVQCLKPFSLVGITVGTAAAGGSPAYSYTYWNGAWTALTLLDTPSFAGTGDTYLTFQEPLDWITNSGTAVSTVGGTAGYYSIKVLATTAPSSTAALATVMWVVSLYDWKEGVTDNAVLNIPPADAEQGIEVVGGSSIVPYFGTAAAGNSVSLECSET